MSTPIVRRIAAALMIAFALTGALPKKSSAQRSAGQVTVALVDRLADSAMATIIRSPGATGSTLILLREQAADSIALASAMRVMFNMRRLHGDTVHARLVMQLYGRAPASALSPNEQQVASRYLARLRNAQRTELEGIGLARVVPVPIATVAQRIPAPR